MQKGSWLESQALNHVAVIDAAGATFRVLWGNIETGQFEDLLVSEKTHESVVMQVNEYPTPNQLGGHRVGNATHLNGATRADFGADGFVVCMTIPWQWLQVGTLLFETLLAASIQARHHLFDKFLILWHGVKIEGASQEQSLMEAILEMTVGGFNRTVLVSDATIVARGFELVMGAQVFVELGEVVGGALSQIAIRCTQAVRSMFFRRATTLPQGILQSLREGYKTFSSLNHLYVLPTAVCQSVMVKQVP